MNKSISLKLLLCVVLSTALRAQDDAPEAAAKPLIIEPAILTIIDQADIPARDAGLLERMNVEEGMLVKAGELLVSLDSREQQMLRGKARSEVEIAAAKAASNVQRDFARVSHEIAKADEARALESEKKFAKSVSQTELDQLRLAVEKTRFEITNAEEEQTLARLTLRLKEQELDLASHKLELRQIVAPFPGVVAQRYRRLGEWVQPGEKVLRLIRTDRLRIEAFVELKQLPPQPENLTVRWVMPLPEEKSQSYQAKITFVSPEANPVNGQVRLWAEIDNTAGTLRAGQVGRLEIVTGKTAVLMNDVVSESPSKAVPPEQQSVVEKLKRVINVSFNRETLENSLLMVAKEIDVPIEIIGDDLQLEGITKNQTFALDEKNKTGTEILQIIFKKVNSNGKLVYIIKPRSTGGPDILFITTRPAVAKRGDKLPPELVLP